MRGKATRRKMREAKFAAQQQNEEGEPSYSSGKYNETDPLGQVDISSDDGNISLAMFLPEADSDTSDSIDNASLAQLLLK
jgi:hypothetical protein